MPRTNAITAEAATITVPTLSRALNLIGVFDGPQGASVLLRTGAGAIESLRADTPEGDLTLKAVGDGWALIQEGATIHRLTMV